MAEHKISANDMVLFISRDGAVTFTPVICLTEFTVDRSTNVIDAATFCGPDKAPGVQGNGVTFGGQVMEDPSTGNISTDELIDLWSTKETIDWKIGKLVPAIGDETDYGTGFISELNKSGTVNDIVKFTGAIAVYGVMDHTTATS